MVACSEKGVFEPLALGLPVPIRFAAGPIPAVSILARLVDDYPSYAVLLADQHEASLFLVDLATLSRTVVLDSSDYPRKQQQGGWSQRRFQARADERVAAFARGIADETQRTLSNMAVDRLVVAGDEVITSALDAAFHPTVKQAIVGTLRLDIRTPPKEVVESASPLVERAQRERELAAVQTLHDAAGANAAGVTGAEETLTALQAEQVAGLILVDDFAATGWADFTMPLYGVGSPPEEHPAAQDPTTLIPVALEDVMIRLSMLTDATVVMVHSAVPTSTAVEVDISEPGLPAPRSEAAAALDQLDGVGALLRFTLDSDQPTATG